MAVLLVGALMLAQTVGFDDGQGTVITVVPVPVEAEPDPEPAPEPVFVVRAVWDRLAACESTSNWRANTGNGYYGGVQMDMTFWRRYGGMAYASRPDLAPREAQVVIAERGLAVQGWAAWPACSRRLGLR